MLNLRKLRLEHVHLTFVTVWAYGMGGRISECASSTGKTTADTNFGIESIILRRDSTP